MKIGVKFLKVMNKAHYRSCFHSFLFISRFLQYKWRFWRYDLFTRLQKKSQSWRVEKLTDSQISHSASYLAKLDRKLPKSVDALKRWDPHSIRALKAPVVCQRKAKCKKKRLQKHFWVFLMCVWQAQSCALIGRNARVCSCFQVAVIWAKPASLICSVGLSKHIRSVLRELTRGPRWVSK